MAEWDPELNVDEALARSLIAERFPKLDSSSLRCVGMGWDNVVWATVDGVAFRFPRRQVAIPGVEREIAVLPILARHLPLAIPDAAYTGSPSPRFRWPWFGSPLIAGREIAAARLNDTQRTALAPLLGVFLRTLHSLQLDCTAALPIDPMGRTNMAIRVSKTSEALANAAALWAPPGWVGALLEEAERLPQPLTTVLVHGDLHLRHLIVDERGTLVGVIDWGDMCQAHPSADLAPYWSLLSPTGRTAFLTAYGPVEEHGLVRARVLALFLCATLATYAHTEGMRDLEHEAIRGLDRTLID